MIAVDPKVMLAQALRAARLRPKLKERVRPEDRQAGTGTNEKGPQVETNYPPNAWPSDGDHD
jgi:hypothetical protein